MRPRQLLLARVEQALGRPESPFYEVTRVWRYWVPYEAMREDDAECVRGGGHCLSIRDAQLAVDVPHMRLLATGTAPVPRPDRTTWALPGTAWTNAESSRPSCVDSAWCTSSMISTTRRSRALSATDRRVVLIIDDVHHAESTQLGLLLSAFVQAVPGNAHVVLSGRGTGAVPVARRRITGVALKLGVRDLAFTADEIRSFFRARDIRVSQGEISAILRRTEGWATGLQLMVVPAIDESHLTPLPLRGDAQAVADYFLEEVLADLDEELREFLLVTSVPEVFTLELAQALSKGTPTTMPIDRLVRLSVVAAQPGDEAVEYHYHPVLREFLLARLRARGRSTVEALEAIAAEWFAGRQDHPAALRHAILSGDPECIEVILRRCGMHLILTGHAAAVLEAITHVSPRLRADPAVRMLLAAAELDLGDASAAAAALPSLAGAGESVAARRWRTGIDLHTALRRGGLLEALDRGEPDLDEPIGEAPLDTYAHLQAAMGELYVGRLDRADEFARLASDQARTTGMAAAELQAGAILNTSALFRGRLRDVVDSATRLDDRWQALGRPESPFYEVTRVWRYWVPYEAMREDDAECALIAAAAVIDNGSEPAIARGLRGMLSLVRAERTDGPHDVALELLDTLAPRDDAPLPVHWYAMMGSFAVHAFHRLEEPTLRDCFLEAMTRGLGAAGDAGVMRAMAALHDRRRTPRPPPRPRARGARDRARGSGTVPAPGLPDRRVARRGGTRRPCRGAGSSPALASHRARSR
nr:hypothetical protein [Microbacterium barkeri]